MRGLGGAVLAAALALSALPAAAQTCDVSDCASTNCADCLTCSAAPGGYCAYYYDLCSSWPECALAAGCEYALPDTGAYAACLASHPQGSVLYAALIDCMVCVQCPGCAPWAWVDPHPGCGAVSVAPAPDPTCSVSGYAGWVCASDADCDDGSLCTLEACVAGYCESAATNDGASCPGGLCYAGACCSG